MPENSLADAEKWAARLPGPGYAIDDQTAQMLPPNNSLKLTGLAAAER